MSLLLSLSAPKGDSAFARDSRVERLPSPALTPRLLSRPREPAWIFLADGVGAARRRSAGAPAIVHHCFDMF
jgi:hypothetical protein